MRIILVISLFFLFACKKDKVSSTTASLLVVNASPNSGNLVLQQNLKSLGAFSYLSLFNSNASLITIDSGFHNYKLLNGSSEVASWLFANDGLNFSFFVCDSAISSKVKYFFMKDNLDTTGLGNRAYIRLVQLSPDLDSMELVTNSITNPSSDSLLIGNLNYFGKFNQSSLINFGTFFPVSGDTSLTIKIKRKLNQSIAKTYQISFKKHKIYSLVLKGYDLRTGRDSLSMSVITHN
jgi:hypothetical protein